MTYINFQIFLKFFLTVVDKIVDLTLRAEIGSFKIYTLNSVIEKKISRLISLCPKLYFE